MGRLFGDRETVFRFGYQLGYDSFFNNIASNAATSSPNVVATAIPSAINATNAKRPAKCDWCTANYGTSAISPGFADSRGQESG